MADYDSRLLLISEEELNALKAKQVPNQKQALIDDDPDELDTLDVNSDGFVVVPEERRVQIFSTNPLYYQTDEQRRTFINTGTPVDSTSINVQNKKMSVVAQIAEETDEYITFTVKIENLDSNCLVIDNMIQIAGIDYSIVDENSISENERELGPSIGNAEIRITPDAIAIDRFMGKIIPNYKNIQSQINAPFTVDVPPFLQQTDSKSLVLCPAGFGYNTNTTKTDNSATDINSNTKKLSKLQLEFIAEAHRWLGYYDTNNTKDGHNVPNVRLIKNGTAFVKKHDDSLIKLMKNGTGWALGLPWCAAFAFSILKKVCNEIGDPFANAHIKQSGLNNGSVASSRYAASKGLLVKKFVPGCVALFQKSGEKGHTMIIIDVRRISGGTGNQVYDVVTIEGNSSGERGKPTGLSDCSKKSGSPSSGGKIVEKKGNEYFIGDFKFLGCVVPKSIQETVPNGNYDIFISDTIRYSR